jgi:hypothetical protein
MRERGSIKDGERVPEDDLFDMDRFEDEMDDRQGNNLMNPVETRVGTLHVEEGRREFGANSLTEYGSTRPESIFKRASERSEKSIVGHLPPAVSTVHTPDMKPQLNYDACLSFRSPDSTVPLKVSLNNPSSCQMSSFKCLKRSKSHARRMTSTKIGQTTPILLTKGSRRYKRLRDVWTLLCRNTIRSVLWIGFLPALLR